MTLIDGKLFCDSNCLACLTKPVLNLKVKKPRKFYHCPNCLYDILCKIGLKTEKKDTPICPNCNTKMEILIWPKDLEKIPISRKIRGRRYKILSLLKSTLEELNYENLIESSMIVSKKGNLIEGGLSLDNFKNKDNLISATVATIFEFNRRFLEIYKNYLGIPLHCFILGDKGCLLVIEAGPIAILACRINQKIKSSTDEDLIHLKIVTSKCAVNIANVISELIPFKEIPELERIQANLLNK